MHLVDTHCHLNFKAFKSDFLEVARRSRQKGTKKIIIVGSDPKTSEEAVRICNEINQGLPGFAHCAVGIHAVHTDRIDFNKIIELTRDSSVVAIGESGIDFFHDQERVTEVEQINLFKKHIELALKTGKPLIIHNRQADEKVREVVDGYPELEKAVLHCFSADHHMAKWAVDRGFFLSFTGNITYGNKKIKKAIERTSVEKIMVETDSPYNIPEPLRSQGVERCEPWMAQEVIKKIASIKKMDESSLTEQFYKNSIEFFKF